MFKLLLVLAFIAGAQAYGRLVHDDHIDDVPEGDSKFDDQFDEVHEDKGHNVNNYAFNNHHEAYDHIDDLPEGDNDFDDQFDHINEENDHDVHGHNVLNQRKASPMYAPAPYDNKYAYDNSRMVNAHVANAYGHNAVVNRPVYAYGLNAAEKSVYAPAYGHNSVIEKPVYAYGHDSVVKPVYAYGHNAVLEKPVHAYGHDAVEKPVYGHEDVYGSGTNGVHGYGSGYRFSALNSPVTAGHYIGYGNKYQFRKNYPYGYGEMLSYTPPKGYSLESGYEKLLTKQPFKYSYNHGYAPLTPVHYKDELKAEKYY